MRYYGFYLFMYPFLLLHKKVDEESKTHSLNEKIAQKRNATIDQTR